LVTVIAPVKTHQRWILKEKSAAGAFISTCLSLPVKAL